MKTKKKKATVSWRNGWDLEMRRFHPRKSRDGASEGGEQWEIIDLERLRIAALAQNRQQAELAADALEFLSCNVSASEFEAAWRALETG